MRTTDKIDYGWLKDTTVANINVDNGNTEAHVYDADTGTNIGYKMLQKAYVYWILPGKQAPVPATSSIYDDILDAII